MKRVLLVLLIGIVCAAVALLWMGRIYFSGWARVRLEQELSRATGKPCTVDALTVSLFPPRLHIGGVAIGATPALARVAGLDARLAPLASLAEGRAVVSVDIDSPSVDLSHLPKSETPAGEKKTPPAGPPRLPPLHLESVDITHAALKFRMGKDTADLTLEQLHAQLTASLTRKGFAAGLAVKGAELQRKSYFAKLDEIVAEGGMDGGGLYLSSARVRGERITADASATLVPHHDTIEATFDPGILGVVVDELAVLSGQAHVNGTLTGNLLDPVDEGQLTITDGAIAHHKLGELSTHVKHRGAKLEFDHVQLNGSRGGQVTGAVDLVVVKEVPLNGELTWDGVDLEGLLAIIGPSIPLNNRLRATTSVHGSLDPMDLDIKATGSLQSTQKETPKDVASFVGGARVHAHDLDAQLELKQPERNTVSARVLINGDTFGGTVRMTAADLAALNPMLPRPLPALALTGQSEGNAEFGGTTDHPTVSGKLGLRGATVVGTRVTRLDGDFGIAAGVLRTQATTLDTIGGQVSLNGGIALEAERANDWRMGLRDLDTDLLLGTVRGGIEL